MKNISLLGSTGSIGTSTLDIVRQNPDEYRLVGLAAGRNLELLKKQIEEFSPELVSVSAPADAEQLRSWCKHNASQKLVILSGTEGAIEVACAPGVDMVIAAMVGAAGLLPTLRALEKGIDVGLANKETMVVAGALMTQAARRSGAKILPVDSEHNAIFQSLQGHDATAVRRLILTASGGPFRQKSLAQLASVTPAEALKHPNWDMGAKITIDSATMMNKGLEVIEAHFLFDVPVEQIDIVVHPQSVVHSMVEYQDGSVLAQLGIPDMRIPIGYALAHPRRLKNNLPSLDLIRLGQLDFFAPDPQRFPSPTLAYRAVKFGNSMPTVLNAANEVAVPHFLDKHIGFLQISETVERIMDLHEKEGAASQPVSLEGLLAADAWARAASQRVIENLSRQK